MKGGWLRLAVVLLVGCTTAAPATSDTQVTSTAQLASGGQGYVLTVTLHDAPVIGANPYMVHLALASTATDAPTPVTDATIGAVLDMPAMGHGAAGNADPQPVGQGDYAGTLNFTMPGEWRLTLVVNRAGTKLGQVEFTWSL